MPGPASKTQARSASFSTPSISAPARFWKSAACCRGIDEALAPLPAWRASPIQSSTGGSMSSRRRRRSCPRLDRDRPRLSRPPLPGICPQTFPILVRTGRGFRRCAFAARPPKAPPPLIVPARFPFPSTSHGGPYPLIGYRAKRPPRRRHRSRGHLGCRRSRSP